MAGPLSPDQTGLSSPRRGRPDVSKDGRGDREIGGPSARILTDVMHLARVDQLAVNVQRKLGILQDGPAPHKGQVMPMAFLDQVRVPNPGAEIARHFRLPVAGSFKRLVLDETGRRT